MRANAYDGIVKTNPVPLVSVARDFLGNQKVSRPQEARSCLCCEDQTYVSALRHRVFRRACSCVVDRRKFDYEGF